MTAAQRQHYIARPDGFVSRKDARSAPEIAISEGGSFDHRPQGKCRRGYTHVVDTSHWRSAQLLTYIKQLVSSGQDSLAVVLQSLALNTACRWMPILCLMYACCPTRFTKRRCAP